MAVCVAQDSNAMLYVTTIPVESCADLVLLTASEFTSYPTLVDIFTMPTASDLGQMWLIFFALPLICYLTAWGLGVVVNFFKPNQED